MANSNTVNHNYHYTTGPSSSSSQSSFNYHFHHYYHNNHQITPMFSIGRLRLALYFICILAITTTLYCLVSYKPESLKSSGFITNPSNIHFHHHYPYPIHLFASTSQILNLVIYNANRYYLDYFLKTNNNNNNRYDPSTRVPNLSTISSELSSLIYLIDNLTQSNQDDEIIIHYYDQNHQQNSFNPKSNGYLEERDDNNNYLEYSNIKFNVNNDLDEEDPSTVEYHLKRLGFNLNHIIYLYALSHPQNVSFTRITPKSMTNDDNGIKASRYHQRYSGHQSSTQQSSSSLSQSPLSSNLSILLPREFIERSTVVFVTAINSNQIRLAKGFIKSFEDFSIRSMLDQSTTTTTDIPKFVLMIYDLGLYPEQLDEIEKLCNKTVTNGVDSHRKLCELRTFQYGIYPSHVSDLQMQAYRSIIIQEMLRDIKFSTTYYEHIRQKKIKKSNTISNNITTIFWLDPQYRFVESKYRLVSQLQNETLHQSGIMSWPIEQPTSALTHPRMFEYFHTTKENFYFHRMIRAAHLMISVDDSTWEPFQLGIMLPWVRCALTTNCIAPLGSQWRSSCRLDKKPHYRFSGCHHYDMSALNVILGIAFNYSSTRRYTTQLSKRFFVPFNRPILPIIDDNQEQLLFEYQFEDIEEEQSKQVPGRFDLVLTDDDIPTNNDEQDQQQQHSDDENGSFSGSSKNFLSSFITSTLSSDHYRHQSHRNR